jgi:hypothetical protein
VNVDYERYVKKQIMERLKREKNDYKDYNAPFISVRGCWLPPGAEVPECGRAGLDDVDWVRPLS